jgi:imidazolonepropionase-like amidohydrolase
MTRVRRAASAGVIALGALLMAPAAGAVTVSSGIVLNDVTIVNTRDGTLLRDVEIAIDGGKIAAIVPADSLTVRAPARRIDEPGEFVVPGYLDMHAHTLQSSDADGGLTLMLANGITGFRQMAGSPELLDARRAGKLPGQPFAPEVLAMPGTIMTHVNAGTAEAAVAEVDRQQAMGADFIKVIETTPVTFFAIAGEAKRQNLTYLGHLPESVNVRDASRAGMRSIEHLGPMSSVLLGCSSDEAALRESLAHRPPPAAAVAQAVNPALATANPIAFTDPFEFGLMQRVTGTYDETKCRQLAAAFIANQTWQVPTLIRLRTMEIGDDPDYAADPALRYVPPATREMWKSLSAAFPAKVGPDARATLKSFFALQMRLTKLLDDAGVPMMAGTDSGGFAQFCIPGFALHEEFDLLDQAHVPALHVLQMTTLNGARFLGREATMGTVDVGKDANLVVLDANPIVSIQNLHKIAGVVRAGKFYSRAALDDLENKVAARNASGTGKGKS